MYRGNRRSVIACTAMATMLLTGLPQASLVAKADDGYKLVWQDDFDGEGLSTKDWNVEEHDPGWVNAELQRYTSLDQGNIKVEDGNLVIRPQMTSGAGEGDPAEKETEISMDIKADGKTSDTIALQVNFGKIDDNDHPTEATAAATVAIDQISLKEVDKDGNESDELLKNSSLDSEEGWIFGATSPGQGSIRYENGQAILSIVNSGEANWNIQLQQGGLRLEHGHSYKLRMTASSNLDRLIELSLLDPDNGYTWYGGGKAMISGNGAYGGGERQITSGRINTQGKHDFRYGRFEARAKVPEGMGYLPAFWLMASDEGLYGQWPKCGEIDIMEVMGQDTRKSYHTIHYGYDSGNGHKQNQGSNTLTQGSYADDYHVYRVDWDPGLITWYVDDKEVYSTRDWYTGQDDDNQLTYPAPFDQNFYIILNLAVGGSWVGYPDEKTYAGMNDQAFKVDYVKVYQKSAETYAREEKEARRPEAAPVVYRQADESGNYVRNGDFSEDIGKDGDENASRDNWKLHLESDAKGTTYEQKDKQIYLKPDTIGSQNHSVQLKQENIPMHKGWEYELSFDASADEARDIVVDVEGPDRGWQRYMQDTIVSVGKEIRSYTLDFTMNEKSDPNGSLEFNLGKQGTKAGVRLSNVRLIHKSGDEIPENNDKVIRPDGNYIYNGSFDMGKERLGYWEYDKDDAGYIHVTNENNVRELKVEVPEGKTIHIGQSKLAFVGAGSYELSFDGYCDALTDGAGLTIKVGEQQFTPDLTDKRKSCSSKLHFDRGLDRDHADIDLIFSKPGTYYLDNIRLCEAALIKNGSFDAGMAGFAPYIYDTVKAKYVIDSMNGNDNAFAITIDDTMADDAGNSWYIQLNQDGVPLKQGSKYRLSLKARSTIGRKISVAMQQYEGNWTNYSKTGAIDVGKEWKDYTFDFTMDDPTDPAARFNITMGSVDGVRIRKQHDIYIDDISLVELDEEQTKPVPGPSAGGSAGQGTSGSSGGAGTTGQTSAGTPSGNKPAGGGLPSENRPTDQIKAEDSEPEKPAVVNKTGLDLSQGAAVNGIYKDADGRILKNAALATDKGIVITDKKGKAIAANSMTKLAGKTFLINSDGVVASAEKVKVFGKIYVARKDGTLARKAFVTLEKTGSRVYTDSKGLIVKNRTFKVRGSLYVAKKSGALMKNGTISIKGRKYIVKNYKVVKTVKKKRSERRF